jgi:hypothetical protein
VEAEAEVLAAQLQKRLLQLDQKADVLLHGKAAYESKHEGARGSIPLGRVEERCVYAAAHELCFLTGLLQILSAKARQWSHVAEIRLLPSGCHGLAPAGAASARRLAISSYRAVAAMELEGGAQHLVSCPGVR